MSKPLEEVYREAMAGLPEHLDIYASQEGEDVLIRRLLKTRYLEPGVYVDVGALHPIRFSNTAHYYMKGWRGINIEPNGDVIDLFRQLRPRDVNLPMAIGDSDAESYYYRFQEPAFNTFDAEQVEFALTKTRLLEKVLLEKQPLLQVLEQHIDDPSELVFFNIDVEGNELEVMKTNDWSIYRPLLVLVEALSDVKAAELETFLREHDYFFVARTKNTYFFAEAAFKKEFVD